MQKLLFASSLAGLVVALAGCGHDSATAESDGELRDLGYALFEVEVPKRQTLVVRIDVPESRDGETFLLLASGHAPQNVGWFDARQRPDDCAKGDLRARAALRDECDVGGEGFLVDEQTGSPGKTFTLQHGDGDALACDERNCTFYYAVVVSPEISAPRPLHVTVDSKADGPHARDPKIRQLQ